MSQLDGAYNTQEKFIRTYNPYSVKIHMISLKKCQKMLVHLAPGTNELIYIEHCDICHT